MRWCVLRCDDACARETGYVNKLERLYHKQRETLFDALPKASVREGRMRPFGHAGGGKGESNRQRRSCGTWRSSTGTMDTTTSGCKGCKQFPMLAGGPWSSGLQEHVTKHEGLGSLCNPQHQKNNFNTSFCENEVLRCPKRGWIHSDMYTSSTTKTSRTSEGITDLLLPPTSLR